MGGHQQSGRRTRRYTSCARGCAKEGICPRAMPLVWGASILAGTGADKRTRSRSPMCMRTRARTHARTHADYAGAGRPKVSSSASPAAAGSHVGHGGIHKGEPKSSPARPPTPAATHVGEMRQPCRGAKRLRAPSIRSWSLSAWIAAMCPPPQTITTAMSSLRSDTACTLQ